MGVFAFVGAGGERHRLALQNSGQFSGVKWFDQTIVGSAIENPDLTPVENTQANHIAFAGALNADCRAVGCVPCGVIEEIDQNRDDGVGAVFTITLPVGETLNEDAVEDRMVSKSEVGE